MDPTPRGLSLPPPTGAKARVIRQFLAIGLQRFLPQSACFLPRASGDVRCRWTLRLRRREARVGDGLVQFWVRAIPLGIAAMLLGFVLKSAGTEAGQAAPGLPGPRVSAFGTIHPELFRLSAPLGSGSPDRIRLASLEPHIGFDAPANGWGTLTDTSACRN